MPNDIQTSRRCPIEKLSVLHVSKSVQQVVVYAQNLSSRTRGSDLCAKRAKTGITLGSEMNSLCETCTNKKFKRDELKIMIHKIAAKLYILE